MDHASQLSEDLVLPMDASRFVPLAPLASVLLKQVWQTLGMHLAMKPPKPAQLD